MSHNETVIVYAKRTPIGKFMGGLSSIPAPRLAASLVDNARQTLKLGGHEVDEIIMGQVLTAGVGQSPARQSAIFGGLPISVCATTVGRVCGSGIKSVMLADQAIRLGDAKVVFAGGQESMSLAPHILANSRTGLRFGEAALKDSMQWDGLWDAYEDMAMGTCAEACAAKYGFSRKDQDNFALESYSRARQAVESGVFASEILPIEVKSRKGSVLIELDEEPFSVDLEKLGSLKPAFVPEGTITAANASSINDGAALVVIMNRKTAEELKLKPIARIVAQASYAHEPKMFATAPVGCIQKLFTKSNLSVKDIDCFEINEAFAVATMAAIKELSLDPAKVNPCGGAVALGHPIGASGTRILVTLLHTLAREGKKRGLATLCIGGGEASGVIVERI